MLSTINLKNWCESWSNWRAIHMTPIQLAYAFMTYHHFLVRLVFPNRMLDKLVIHDRNNFARIVLRWWFWAENTIISKNQIINLTSFHSIFICLPQDQSAFSLIADLRPWWQRLLDTISHNWIRNLLQLVVHERNSDDPVSRK